MRSHIITTEAKRRNEGRKCLGILFNLEWLVLQIIHLAFGIPPVFPVASSYNPAPRKPLQHRQWSEGWGN